MGSRPLRSTHGKGRFAVNINVRARATTRATLTSQQLLIMNGPAERETGW